jgi:hypothetical protein
MNSARDRSPRFRVGDLVKYSTGKQTVVAKVIEDRGPIGVNGRRLFRIQEELGQDYELPEEYLELEEGSEPVTVRAGASKRPPSTQAFDIKYIRRSNTNHWSATVERRQGLDGALSVGVVAYTSGSWNAERQGDERLAIVTVLVDRGSKNGDPRPVIDEARRLADERFREVHPGALIEYAIDQPA